MSGENFRAIQAFLAVARERSFTRAAAQMGVSQSALSHTIRALEERLELRLLTRTTRSVAPTEAGERLIQKVAPRFEAITGELAAFEELRDKPAGVVRIAASDFAVHTMLWPTLSRLQPQYPDVKMELAIAPGLSDIASGRFDAGVRQGDQIAKGMTAVRIAPDIRMVIVGAPSYLQGRAVPRTPSELTGHACIKLRFSEAGEVYAWKLKKGRQSVQVRVDGAWTFNSIYLAIDAALAGFGLAYVPEALVRPHIQGGRLQAMLQDWCPAVSGLHIFFASQRQSSPALSLVVEALRYRR